ncbi:MAG: hypothetical protein EF811_04050 [Methanonatronarchaeia archaeon]|nr:MAG: hypothetical protein EF811_04050 [Methanonatronarchaeia archaeon]
MLGWLRKKIGYLLGFKDPVDYVTEIEDSSDKLVVWIFKDDVSNKVVNEYMENLKSAYINFYGRDSNCLQVGCTNLEEIKKLSIKELKKYMY